MEVPLSLLKTMTKQEIRKHIKVLKLNLSNAARKAAAQAVFAQVEQMAEFKRAQRILVYNSLPDELPTEEFIAKHASTKSLFLPRVHGNDLEILAYSPTELHIGAFHIEEPTGNDLIDPTTMDLIIVPAVALDKQGNRLGRGKGYYDRLLRLTSATTIGVGYDIQLIDEGLPTEPHDIKLTHVITESFKL